MGAQRPALSAQLYAFAVFCVHQALFICMRLTALSAATPHLHGDDLVILVDAEAELGSEQIVILVPGWVC